MSNDLTTAMCLGPEFKDWSRMEIDAPLTADQIRGKMQRKEERGMIARQKRWREAVRELGPWNGSGFEVGEGAVIHHPVGRTAKHRKTKIGDDWVIPLRDRDHKLLHDHNETFGFGSRRDFEKAVFSAALERLKLNDDIPSRDVINAILSYRR